MQDIDRGYCAGANWGAMTAGAVGGVIILLPSIGGSPVSMEQPSLRVIRLMENQPVTPPSSASMTSILSPSLRANRAYITKLHRTM
jgi:hypothetical protein